MSLVDHYLRKLEKSPGYEQFLTNSWADYIELVCLANIDNEISEDDIIDRLSGRVRDLREDTDTDLSELDELEDESDGIEPTERAKISDKWDMRVKDYFKVLLIRQSLYGDYYPFEVIDNYIRRKDSLEEKHFLYVYLLLCSNLYLFDKSTGNQFANYFELISLNAFKRLLPNNAEAHLFGKNPYNRNNRFSKGSFWKKLNLLINNINEKINPHIKQRDFSEYHTGDEGLDLVAWIPTGDDLPSLPIHFAQCACTYDFVDKQHSSSSKAWSHKISFKNPPSNSTFIPHCFRGAERTWIKSTAIMDTFLIDRKRILNFYTDSEDYKFSHLPIYDTVRRIVNLKEDVV